MGQMRNFGHAGFDKFDGVGINGKNSEFHAAMGLCNLVHIEHILDRRKRQCSLYDELLNEALVQKITIQKDSVWNYAYYPVIFENEDLTIKVKSVLEMEKIFPRRYFFPSLDTLDYLDNDEVHISNNISKRILCLPLYHKLENKGILKISDIIREVIH